MKTRVTFEPSDFIGSGQLIIRDSFSIGDKDYKFGITVCEKIGYDVKNKTKVRICLSDGHVLPYDSIEALCESLNNDEYGYRPMSRHEINMIIVGQGSRFPE